MKQDTVMRVALWLVEVTSSGLGEEAFAGDLLELLAAGRSRRWCFAQALRRMTSAIEERLRSLLMPLWFCIGFVLLHPLWQRLCAPSVANLLTRYRETSQWPGSAVLEMIAGLLPAVFFVWAGIFIYSLLRHRSLQLHLVSALLSLNVGVCLLTLAMMIRLHAMQPDLRLLSSVDFYYPLVHARFSILLFLSLFGAVLALPHKRCQSRPRYYLARLLARCGLVRMARRFEIETFLMPQVSAQNFQTARHPAKRLA